MKEMVLQDMTRSLPSNQASKQKNLNNCFIKILNAFSSNEGDFFSRFSKKVGREKKILMGKGW